MKIKRDENFDQWIVFDDANNPRRYYATEAQAVAYVEGYDDGFENGHACGANNSPSSP